MDTRIYQAVIAELRARHAETGAHKHTFVPSSNLVAWLTKLDMRLSVRGGKKTDGGIVFTADVCQRILRSKCTDVRAMRQRIADAIVGHRTSPSSGASAMPTRNAEEPEEEPDEESEEEKEPEPKKKMMRVNEVTTEEQGRATLAFAGSKVPPKDRQTIALAAEVLNGVEYDRRDICARLAEGCGSPDLAPLMKAAYGVVFGDPPPHDVDALVDSAVDARLRTAYPADGERLCFALGVVRRCIVPGASLDSVLGPGQDRLEKALRLLHSWGMRVDAAGGTRAPTPWIADTSRVAMRMLDDLI